MQDDRLKLGTRAETFLDQSTNTIGELPSEDIKKLIEDLHLHRIELQMQNDQLRRAQMDLETARDRYADLFDHAPVGYFTISTEGRIKEANRQGAALLGMAQGSLIGQYFRRFISREDQDSFHLLCQNISESNSPQSCELELQHENGRTLFARLDCAGLTDASGRLRRFRLTLSDITSTKKAHEEIRRIKEEWERTFDAIGEIVTIHDKNMRLVRMNRITPVLLQTESEALLGKTCHEIFRGTTTPCIDCQLTADVVLNRTHTVEVEHVHSGRILLVSISPIYDDAGHFAGSVHYAKDITHQKQMEDQARQSQKMEALGTLAGGIAHDFNNILGIIVGNTELAIDDLPERHAVQECLSEIKAASVRATQVVRHILDFARKSAKERIAIEMLPIVADTLKLLRASIPSFIEIKQNFACNYDTILADPSQITQVLMNICTNAAQAMQESGGVIEVNLLNIELKKGQPGLNLPPGRYIKLSVKDNGPGIDSKVLERIFEPYFTTKKSGGGTGMGLAVVHGIVKAHDGAIQVLSAPGRGTLVQVFFPLVETDAADATEDSTVLPSGNEHILLVDDEPALVRTAEHILHRLGYQVSTRTDSRKAMELFKSDPDRFDLVITDMAMPKITGDRLAEELMKIRPGIPIILCTGHSERFDEASAKKIGIRAYVAKPYAKKDLARIVRKVLDA